MTPFRPHLLGSLSARFGQRARGNAWAIADQVSVGGTSFLTTILVGRFGGPAELGLYSLGFVILMALVATQESLLTTPLTIYHPQCRGGRQRRYLSASLAQFASQTLLFALALCAAALVAMNVPESRFDDVLWALALAIPFRLLLEMARRMSFAELEPWQAFRLDAIANVGQIALMLLLWHNGLLTAPTAFVAMGIASSFAACIWLVSRRQAIRTWSRSTLLTWGKNWSLGRWLLARQAVMFASMGAVPWMIALLIGDVETGRFAACLMLVNLANPLIVAINNMLTPQASRAFAAAGFDGLQQVVLRATASLFAVASALCLVLLLLGDPLMRMFYGESFAGSGTLLFVLAVNGLISALGLPFACGLVVLERARLCFALQFFGVLAMVATTLVLLVQIGVLGAGYGYLVGNIVTTATTAWAYALIVRWRRAELAGDERVYRAALPLAEVAEASAGRSA